MKNHLTCAFAALAAGSAAAAEIVVPINGIATNRVESGSVTQEDRVKVAKDAAFYKTGAGTMLLPETQVDQAFPPQVRVLEGGVAFPATGGNALPAAMALPDTLKAKFVLWVDASDANAAHFVGATSNDTGKVYLDRWHDVRETDVAAPKHMYAQAAVGVSKGFAPQRVTKDGFASVYFGGAGSGRHMKYKTAAGADYTLEVRHVFAVHGVDQSYGSIFGQTGGAAAGLCSPNYDGNATLLHGYAWMSEWPYMNRGEFYVNGERVDAHAERVRRGFQLYDFNTGNSICARSNSFFGRGTTASGCGGDYLCEAMIATTPLTEEERMLVETYLMRKWLAQAKAGGVRVALAADTTLTLDAPSGTTRATGRRFAVSGEGNLVKTGEGTYTIESRAPEAFAGALEIREGAVNLAAPVPLALKAGDRVTADCSRLGPNVKVTSDADADTIVKDGAEVVTAAELPSDVKALKVNAGGLVLRAATKRATAPSARDILEIPIKNHSFEDYGTTLIPDGCMNLTSIQGKLEGWQSSDASFVYDYARWKAHGAVPGQADGATIAAWNLELYPPNDGAYAIYVRSQVWQVIEIPTSGVYEVSFDIYPRAAYPSGYAEVYLMDSATGETVTWFGRHFNLGSCKHQKQYGFHRIHWRAPVSRAGTYKLCFKDNSWGFAFDDVHLVRIPDAEEGWPVPGGQFDDGTFIKGNNNNNVYDYTNANTHAKWTFTQDPTWTNRWMKTAPAVGLATPIMMGRYDGYMGGVFNATRGESKAGAELLMIGCKPCSAATTFTPPAGTWFLQADLARYGATACALKATVTCGETSTELGQIVPNGRLMAADRWPVAFVADGATPVTLTLSIAASGATGDERDCRGVWVDDLMLMPTGFDGHDLVTDGVFETSTSYGGGSTAGTLPANPTLGQWYRLGLNTWIARPYGEAHAAFGYDDLGYLNGHFSCLTKNDGLVQAIAIDSPGRYRLTFDARGRTTYLDANYGPMPVEAYLANPLTGETNWLGRTSGTCTNAIPCEMNVYVKDAGTYHLGIRGVWSSAYTGSRESHIDNVSFRKVHEVTSESAPRLSRDLSIALAEDTFMTLDFEGTQTVRRVRIDGQCQFGVVDATTQRGRIYGSGALYVERIGFMMIVR